MKTVSGYTFYERTILDNIDFESYDIETNGSDFDKVRSTVEIMLREYQHKNNRHLPLSVLAKEWLQGLPSVLTVPFYNHDILQNALLHGFNLDTEDLEDDFLEEYWSKLGATLIMLNNNL